MASDVVWPPLPKSGFVAPRVATADDVEAGNAIFSISKDGSVGRVAEIDVPQFAFYLDGQNKVPAIILQAEYSVDEALYFELLGTNNPN
jgi:hypothetical protein